MRSRDPTVAGRRRERRRPTDEPAGRAVGQRPLRVGEELRHLLAQILRDGEIATRCCASANITVTEVRISPDLRNATVLCHAARAAPMPARWSPGLRRGAAFLRGLVARDLTLRHVPNLVFEPRPDFRPGRSHFSPARIAREDRDANLPPPAKAGPTTMADGRDPHGLAPDGREPDGRKLDGWLVLDKPAGMTSTRAVERGPPRDSGAKAGHGGTLDPLATGVLPIALGEATKTVAWAMGGRKRYRFTVRWGDARDSDDSRRRGRRRKRRCGRNRGAIEAMLRRFTGDDHADARRTIPRSSSPVGAPTSWPARGKARRWHRARSRSRACAWRPSPTAITPNCEAIVGKGTYIRALARDLARSLGTLGHVAALRRLAVGRFTEAQAISLEFVARLAA